MRLLILLTAIIAANFGSSRAASAFTYDGATRDLTRMRHARLAGRHIWWKIQWELPDMWVGAFWQNYPGKVYVWMCLIPCTPIRIEIWKRGTGAP